MIWRVKLWPGVTFSKPPSTGSISVHSSFFSCVRFLFKTFPLFFARIFAFKEFLTQILSQRVLDLIFSTLEHIITKRENFRLNTLCFSLNFFTLFSFEDIFDKNNLTPNFWLMNFYPISSQNFRTFEQIIIGSI